MGGVGGLRERLSERRCYGGLFMKRVVGFALVRLLGELVVFVGLAVGFALVAGVAHLPNIVGLWVTLGLAVATVIFVERYAAGKRAAEIGFAPGRAVADGLAGVAIGAGMFCIVIGVLFFAGDYRVIAVRPSIALLGLFLTVLPAAAIEEIVMRGIVFRLLSQWGGTWIALALSAVLFGALHLHNPGATWVAAAAIALEAGVLLAAAFVATGNLWLPIGLHFAWNFMEGPIFGTQLSGGTIASSLFDARVSGPQWLAGGKFGPEAGVAALLVGVTAAAVLLVYAHRRNLIVPCPWLRRADGRGTSAVGGETRVS